MALVNHFNPTFPGLSGEVIHTIDKRIVYRVKHGYGWLQTEVPTELVMGGSPVDITNYLTKWEASAFGKTIAEEEEAVSLDDLIETEEVEKKVDYGKWAVK